MNDESTIGGERAANVLYGSQHGDPTQWEYGGHVMTPEETAALLNRQSAEIERLRAELERLPAAIVDAAKQYKAALDAHCAAGGRLFKETH